MSPLGHSSSNTTQGEIILDRPEPEEMGERLLAMLHRAYNRHYNSASSTASVSKLDIYHKALRGVVFWEDLELCGITRLIAQIGSEGSDCADSAGSRGSSNDEAMRSGDLKEVIRTRDIQELFNALSSLSMEDALTGLFNRRYFDHRLGQELQRSQREQSPCSVMLVDIDDFKLINDRLGHDVGDLALQHLARMLKSSLRVTDEVTARFGGEEFAIILPNTSREYAPLVGERLRSRIEHSTGMKHRSGDGELQPLPSMSISVGLSTAVPPKSKTPDQLVKEADLALYEAKRAGKNTVRIFESAVRDPAEGVGTQEREALLG